jgi:uncharacterized membrane protein YphA (DoxX/SURF4 family)
MSGNERVGGAILIVLGLAAFALVVVFVVTGFSVENRRAYAGGNMVVDARSEPGRFWFSTLALLAFALALLIGGLKVFLKR